MKRNSNASIPRKASSIGSMALYDGSTSDASSSEMKRNNI